MVLEKAEEPEIKLPTSTGSWKKQESSRKASISALLTMPKPLTVWITINWCSVCRPSQAAGCLSMCCPGRGVGVRWSQGPAGVARKGVYRRLEPRLVDAQEWRAPWPCFCCWPTWGQSAAHMALCWLTSGPSFPPLQFLGIMIQARQAWLPGRVCAVLLGLLPHPAGNLGCWLLPCSCLDLPMISVKLLPLPKIAT